MVRLHHGTDALCANDLAQNGIDQKGAAAWNGTGEFWATIDHHRAKWFALSHPDSPPAACFEFDLAKNVIEALLQMSPPVVLRHGQTDYEFLPSSHAVVNHHMTNRQVVAVP